VLKESVATTDSFVISGSTLEEVSTTSQASMYSSSITAVKTSVNHDMVCLSLTFKCMILAIAWFKLERMFVPYRKLKSKTDTKYQKQIFFEYRSGKDAVQKSIISRQSQPKEFLNEIAIYRNSNLSTAWLQYV
jgi:hypothetical protein